ncbi:hypothetical protein ONE63_004849 [Megalurothrips usitatus]|uniref:Uncharacterized protein n=1 Tax=Megalurothrips usitatus TaxID=439358 RepID=A0AAV7X4D4_9NEOP|nr:hypothetical protein ONE63_004849 [Megalurothrips usitatus]
MVRVLFVSALLAVAVLAAVLPEGECIRPLAGPVVKSIQRGSQKVQDGARKAANGAALTAGVGLGVVSVTGHILGHMIHKAGKKIARGG